MPQFLIDKLKREYPGNDHAVYGTLNKLGAMHGNRETERGRQMQAKHDRDYGARPMKAATGLVDVDEENDQGGPPPPLPAPPALRPGDLQAAPPPYQTATNTAPPPYAGGPSPAPPPAIAPPPARQAVTVGENPAQERYDTLQAQAIAQAQKKLPFWRMLAGAALSATNKGQGAAQMLLHPQNPAANALPYAQAGAEEARRVQAAQQAGELRHEQTEAAKAARMASVAQHEAAARKPETVADRAKYLPELLKQFPGLTQDQQAAYVVNGKLPEFAPKNPPRPVIVPPGGTVLGDNNQPVYTAPKETKAESLEETIASKTKIADANHLKGAERNHFIYGTPIPNQNVIQIPGLGNNAPPGSGGLTGEEYLKTLPPGTAAQVQAISEGRAALPPLSSRGSGALLRDAVFRYDPQFNEQRAQMRRAFTSGKQGDNIRALNTATVHLDQLHDAAVAMKNGTFQPGNAVYNYVATKFGSDKVTNHAFVMNALAGEAATALKGNATDPEIAHVLSTLQPNMSPAQALGVTEAGLHVFGAKLNTAEESYRQTNPDDKVWSPVLPTAKNVFAKYNIQPLQTPAQIGGAANNFTVTDPRGKVHTFRTQKDADNFKRAAGIP